MSEVYVSSIYSDHRIGLKQGTRTKYYGHDWEEPSETVPSRPPEVEESAALYWTGIALERERFPEACYVFNEKQFKRTSDLLACAGFYIVKGKLAAVLADMDLGGGGLIPFPIFYEDKATPYPGEHFLLNFGSQKQCFLPHESDKSRIEEFFTVERHGVEVWDYAFTQRNGDIAVSESAVDGADIWFDPKLRKTIFMSGRLVAALEKAKVKVDFRLGKCRIVQSGDAS